MYSADDKPCRSLSQATDLRAATPATAHISPEKADDGKNEDTVMIPWKVAVDRELSRFNQEIVAQFEEDSSVLFGKALREVSEESTSKIDKYLHTK